MRPPAIPDAVADPDALLSRATLDMADEHVVAFAFYLGDARDRERDERRAVIDRFEKIARSNYQSEWNRSGRKFGTPIHRAARRQKVAEACDELVKCGIKHAITSARTSEGRLVGLEALVNQAEREWRRAHLAALGEQEAVRG